MANLRFGIATLRHQRDDATLSNPPHFICLVALSQVRVLPQRHAARPIRHRRKHARRGTADELAATLSLSQYKEKSPCCQLSAALCCAPLWRAAWSHVQWEKITMNDLSGRELGNGRRNNDPRARGDWAGSHRSMRCAYAQSSLHFKPVTIVLAVSKSVIFVALHAPFSTCFNRNGGHVSQMTVSPTAR